MSDMTAAAKMFQAILTEAHRRGSAGRVFLPSWIEGIAEKHLQAAAAQARAEMKERCAEIALAIDSGRGNEKEIAAAIRARSTD